MVDLYGTIKYWEAGGQAEFKHLVVPLLGRFKGETGETYHLLCTVDRTNHGLEPRKWVGRYMQSLVDRGIRNGHLFWDANGSRMKAGYFEPQFFHRLSQVQQSNPELLSQDIEVEEEFGIFSSFRQGATSEAVNNGVQPDQIDANNRWRKMYQARGSRPTLAMREHYTDVRLTLNHRLMFSRAL
jgi:hypothetical protein